MAGVELDRGDEHRITYHEFNPDSDKLVVCFAHQGGGIGAEGFGTGLCRAKGWNHVYVGKARQSKFRSLSIERFRDAVGPITAGRDVITYGASAGGYAALYFGGAINARILAASPRHSQHPMNLKVNRKRRTAGGDADARSFGHRSLISRCCGTFRGHAMTRRLSMILVRRRTTVWWPAGSCPPIPARA